jgi:hypothetical protein
MQPGLIAEFSEGLRCTEGLSQTEIFRANFQNALRECIRHRFSVEESFGMIWVETLEEVPLLPEEQAQVYDVLIGWAKTCGDGQLFSIVR